MRLFHFFLKCNDAPDTNEGAQPDRETQGQASGYKSILQKLQNFSSKIRNKWDTWLDADVVAPPGPLGHTTEKARLIL